MANEKPLSDADVYRPAVPTVHTIGVADLTDALTKGIADFKAMPTHLVHFCWIYPVVVLIGARSYAGSDVLPLAFPLLTGYTLIGPIVATGMYELSRRREMGLDISRMHAFEVVRSPSIRSIAFLSILLAGFVSQIFTTSAGWGLIIVGCTVGFIFAAVVFALSVMSFPLLLDRDVGLMTAVGTSIRAVVRNPITMFFWGLIIAVTLGIGSIPFFVGIAVVMPVLGHATWHLYRKTIES
jgi:uncharacterized membrane protein